MTTWLQRLWRNALGKNIVKIGIALSVFAIGLVAFLVTPIGVGQQEESESLTELQTEIDLFETALPLVEPLDSKIFLDFEHSGRPDILGLTDFNKDHFPDLLVMDEKSLVLYEADGNGRFSRTSSAFFESSETSEDNGLTRIQPTETRFQFLDAVIADFDNNEIPDVAVLVDIKQDQFSIDAIDRRIYIFLANSQGFLEVQNSHISIQAPISEDFSDQPTVIPQTLQAADTDHDGAQDILLANMFIPSSAPIQVFNAIGNGEFDDPNVLDLGNTNELAILDLKTIDVNNDQLIDLAVSTEKGITFYFMLADRSFAIATAVPFENANRIKDFAISDIDNDGLGDVLALNNLNELILVLQNDERDFQVLGRHQFEIEIGQIQDGDLNGDGLLDLLLTASNQQSIFELLGDGTGKFAFSEFIGYLVPEAIDVSIVSDLNNDGIDDAFFYTSRTTRSQIHQETPIGLGRIHSVGGTLLADADLDGDNSKDLILIGSDNTLEIKWNNGRGVFLSEVLSGQNVQTFLRAAAEDFDGDGQDEVVLLSTSSTSISLTLLGANEDREIQIELLDVIPDEGMPNLGTGDFDSNGHLDFFATGTSNLHFFLGDGTGGFTHEVIPVEGELGVAASGDFDGDVQSEILAVHIAEHAEYFMHELIDGKLESSGSLTALIALPMSINVGDFNADGIDDAVALSIEIEAVLDESAGGEESADTYRMSVTGAILSSFTGIQGDQPVPSQDVLDWPMDLSPYPFTGLAIGNVDARPGSDIAISFNDIRNLNIFSSFDSRSVRDQTEIDCPGGPLFISDLDSQAQSELVSSSIDLNPQICIFWNGGASR